MQELVKIQDAKTMRSGINVKGEITKKDSPRTINLKSGGTVDVCDATLDDGSDSIKLALWGEDIAKVQVGSVVTINNGYTNEFKGEVSLTKGKFGEMEVNSS